MSASIGITVFPDDGEDQEMLLKNADTAMYKCKEDGRNHFHFYTEEMNRHAQALLKMELELRKALQREEFVLHYQPLICTTTGQIMGVEALYAGTMKPLAMLLLMCLSRWRKVSG